MIPGLCSLLHVVAGSRDGLSAIANPTFLQGANGVTTVGTATATPLDGTGPYTYLWTQTSGATTSILTPNAASTDFDCISLTPGDNLVCTYSCLVTDSAALTGYTNQVSVNFFLIG